MSIERGDACWIEVYSGAWIKPGGQVDASLDPGKDMIETTSKDSAGWKENIDGYKGWTMSMTCMFDEADAGYAAIKNAYDGDTNMNVRFFDGTNWRTGYCIVGGPTITSPKDDAKQYTVEFTGDGPLT